MKIEILELQEGVSNASLTAYIQEFEEEYIANTARPAVIICPGGAYMGITEKEAEPVAIQFLSKGFRAFVLRYSIGVGNATFPAPFIDAAKAISLIRTNADRWRIDPDKICLCGFSTGGQVAAYLSATWQEDYLSTALKIDNKQFRPNALILGYPILDLEELRLRKQKESEQMDILLEMISGCVYGSYHAESEITKKWKLQEKITDHMPATFLWTTMEDTYAEVDECYRFIKALAAKKVPYELHVFEHGSHGISLGNSMTGLSLEMKKSLVNAERWFSLAVKWLSDQFEKEKEI